MYIGETSRCLETRIKEHKDDMEKHSQIIYTRANRKASQILSLDKAICYRPQSTQKYIFYYQKLKYHQNVSLFGGMMYLQNIYHFMGIGCHGNQFCSFLKYP